MSIKKTDAEIEMEEQVEQALEDMTEGAKFKLRRPVMYNGEEITELTFDFEKLSGDDQLKIEAELAARNIQIVTTYSSGEFLIRMARNACEQSVNVDFFRKLSIVDFNKIESRARFFLLGLAPQTKSDGAQ